MWNNCELIESALKKWYRNLPDGHPAKDHAHYCRVDENGIYFPDNISWPGGGGPKYTVLHPITKKPVKIPSRGWLTNESTMNEWISQGRVAFGTDENAVPTLKSYLKDREYSVIGDVTGKNVILVDDMVDTAGTITKAADLMMQQGALSVRAVASHCVMSGAADERVEKSALTEIVFTDSIPYTGTCTKVKQLSIADMFAETILRNEKHESISSQYLV